MRKIMACLDIGSDTIKCVVGECVKRKLNILAVSEVESDCMKNGLVANQSDLIEPLNEAIKRCEEIIGLNINQVIVSVPSTNSIFNAVSSSIEINSEDKIITGKDVIEVVKEAIKNNKTKNYEYITMMPTSFILDDNRSVNDPKGLTSNSLSVRGVMVSTPKENIYPILAVLEHLNIDVVDITINIIGDYIANRTKEMNKSIGITINIGGETTTLGVFNKGVLTNSSVINLGGKNIDNDISFIYKINNKEAKYLKEKFAVAHKNEAQTSSFKIVTNNMNEEIKVNQYELSEIVQSRMLEILNLCKKEINHLTKKEISYIIVTGGLTECKSFNLVLEEIFNNKAVIGSIKEIGVRNNKYSTCVGLIKYYAKTAQLKDKDFSIFSIEQQQELSGANIDIESDSVIGKLFSYIFNG